MFEFDQIDLVLIVAGVLVFVAHYVWKNFFNNEDSQHKEPPPIMSRQSDKTFSNEENKEN
ncbi:MULTISPECIES: hypothetical protein [Photorhabdus]|uniref:Uncharacterized protein n=2 Tax=Photorhabdus TaxID=29487 RepID=A0AAW6BS09_9GAMM|nr:MULTISPECIES: hypothetical protein [Photorhabdus]EYU15075.1 hypothetical protein BA1DRAFT_02344 [Photorhabdus aegyptia]MDB6374767.1 hypothetical protein [Photorhabdus bodei]